MVYSGVVSIVANIYSETGCEWFVCHLFPWYGYLSYWLVEQGKVSEHIKHRKDGQMNWSVRHYSIWNELYIPHCSFRLPRGITTLKASQIERRKTYILDVPLR